jgi:hypothetical protein
MGEDVDQKAVDSAPASEPADQAIKMTMFKRGDVTQVTLEGEASALMRSLGTKDPDFRNGLIHQVGNAGSNGEYPDELGIKFMLAFIRSREPRDEIEAALIAQMAATHVAAMRFANRLAHAESLQEQDSAERAFNKLTRTFAVQVEALQRYRHVSSQNVIVQHVSVGDGGQAISNVTRPAHGRSLTGRLPLTPALPDGQQAPMEIIGERQRAPVSRRRRKG